MPDFHVRLYASQANAAKRTLPGVRFVTLKERVMFKNDLGNMVEREVFQASCYGVKKSELAKAVTRLPFYSKEFNSITPFTVI